MEPIAFTRTQRLTVYAFLCALILLFLVIPLQIGPVQLAVIPLLAVIVGAETAGWRGGLFTGLFFGLISFAGAYLQPTLLSPAFQNPLVSVLPRVFIGLSAYGAAKGLTVLFKKLPASVAYAAGAAAGVMTNTFLVVGMILAFYFGRTYFLGDASVYIGWEWMTVLLGGNFLIEILVAVIAVPPVVLAIRKAKKHS